MWVSNFERVEHRGAHVFHQTASDNKKQIRDIYRRIDALATSLRCGTQDGDMLSSEHQKAIMALARYGHLQHRSCHTLVLTFISDVKILEEDLGDILQERKSRFKRFIRAKRHREELQDIITQLEAAKTDYMVRLSIAGPALRCQTYALPDDDGYADRSVAY